MDDATIIKALRACGKNAKCSECPLHGNRNTECFPAWTAAADRIEALAKQAATQKAEYVVLMSELLECRRERDTWKARADAAEMDMRQLACGNNCEVCFHEDEPMSNPYCDTCDNKRGESHWQWRGPCAENGGNNGNP